MARIKRGGGLSQEEKDALAGVAKGGVAPAVVQIKKRAPTQSDKEKVPPEPSSRPAEKPKEEQKEEAPKAREPAPSPVPTPVPGEPDDFDISFDLSEPEEAPGKGGPLARAESKPAAEEPVSREELRALSKVCGEMQEINLAHGVFNLLPGKALNLSRDGGDSNTISLTGIKSGMTGIDGNPLVSVTIDLGAERAPIKVRCADDEYTITVRFFGKGENMRAYAFTSVVSAPPQEVPKEPEPDDRVPCPSPRCGKMNAPHIKFCLGCGTEMKPRESEPFVETAVGTQIKEPAAPAAAEARKEQESGHEDFTKINQKITIEDRGLFLMRHEDTPDKLDLYEDGLGKIGTLHLEGDITGFRFRTNSEYFDLLLKRADGSNDVEVALTTSNYGNRAAASIDITNVQVGLEVQTPVGDLAFKTKDISDGRQTMLTILDKSGNQLGEDAPFGEGLFSRKIVAGPKSTYNVAAKRSGDSVTIAVLHDNVEELSGLLSIDEDTLGGSARVSGFDETVLSSIPTRENPNPSLARPPPAPGSFSDGSKTMAGGPILPFSTDSMPERELGASTLKGPLEPGEPEKERSSGSFPPPKPRSSPAPSFPPMGSDDKLFGGGSSKTSGSRTSAPPGVSAEALSLMNDSDVQIVVLDADMTRLTGSDLSIRRNADGAYGIFRNGDTRACPDKEDNYSWLSFEADSPVSRIREVVLPDERTVKVILQKGRDGNGMRAFVLGLKEAETPDLAEPDSFPDLAIKPVVVKQRSAAWANIKEMAASVGSALKRNAEPIAQLAVGGVGATTAITVIAATAVTTTAGMVLVGVGGAMVVGAVFWGISSVKKETQEINRGV
ncbi:MAG: hypothetical protein ABIH29_02910 [Candidatus Micrarchaeota archaeon]